MNDGGIGSVTFYNHRELARDAMGRAGEEPTIVCKRQDAGRLLSEFLALGARIDKVDIDLGESGFCEYYDEYYVSLDEGGRLYIERALSPEGQVLHFDGGYAYLLGDVDALFCDVCGGLGGEGGARFVRAKVAVDESAYGGSRPERSSSAPKVDFSTLTYDDGSMDVTVEGHFGPEEAARVREVMCGVFKGELGL